MNTVSLHKKTNLLKTLKFKTYFITWKSNATHISFWNYHLRVKALDLRDQELSVPVWWVPTALIHNHNKNHANLPMSGSNTQNFSENYFRIDTNLLLIFLINYITNYQRINIYYIVSALHFRALMKILTCNIQNINVLMTTWKYL